MSKLDRTKKKPKQKKESTEKSAPAGQKPVGSPRASAGKKKG
jgi:hypothetical protein